MSEPAAGDQGVMRFFTDVWPLLALGLIGAVMVRACLPVHPLPSPRGLAAPSDPKTAVGVGNWQAMAALNALTPQASVTQVLQAFNLIVIDFKEGSSTVPDDAEPVLLRVAATIASRPDSERFEIASHTDGSLSPLADLELSRRRAQAVVDFLVNAGVSAQRLQARALGDAEPLSSEPDQEARAHQQRVEFSLLP
jgi:outer membrane protein OmpA-like peptidoglycan-associated protein